jgi:hypothetical protein
LAEEGVRKMRLKKKHNEEFLDLYPSPNILEVTKSRKMKLARIVSRIGKIRNVYRVLVADPERKNIWK